MSSVFVASQSSCFFLQWRTLREILGGGGARNFQHVCLWCRFKLCESFKYNACDNSFLCSYIGVFPCSTCSQAFKIRIQALKIQIQGFKIRIQGFKIRIQAFKIQILALKIRIQAFKIRIQPFKIRILAFKIRIQGGRNFQHVCIRCPFKISESFKYNAWYIKFIV